MKTIAECVGPFLASREARNLRTSSLVNYGIWCRWMAANWGARPVTGIEPQEIAAFATAKSRSAAQHLQTFLRWLITERTLPRSFEVGTLPLPPCSDEREIVFLTPRQAHAFLEAVNPEFHAAFALGLYAGLRPTECCRIHWESIHLGERRVRVEARVSKIRRARIIEGVPPLLWWWLKRSPSHRGRVLPARNEACAVYRWIRERERAAREAEVVLSHDVFRHSFATHFVALTGNLGATAKILGHYKLQTLIAHYDGVTTRAQAREYFRRVP